VTTIPTCSLKILINFHTHLSYSNSYRKEKDLKQLEEHFTSVMIENSVSSEEQHKLEIMEAKLLRAYEDLNRVEVERKRIEQIVKACDKNPPNNEEQIRVSQSAVANSHVL